jgi:hypothetical protein
LFPITLDDPIPADHICRMIDAFVDTLPMSQLGFERAEAADTGRPGYDPRDLLKLYLYGYLNQSRSSRRLEAECRRNVEIMWLLGRLEKQNHTDSFGSAVFTIPSQSEWTCKPMVLGFWSQRLRAVRVAAAPVHLRPIPLAN